MKKLFLGAAIAVLGLTSVNAQSKGAEVGYTKGDIFATGSIGFGSTTFGDEKSNQFSFNPSAGYFVSNNIAVGVALGLETAKDENDIKTNAYTAGVFGQYYFTPQNQFSFVTQLSALYIGSKTELGANELKGNGFVVGFAPGVSYFISNHLVLQANVGLLSYSTFEFDGVSDSTNNFSVGLDLSNIDFGITYKF